MKTTTLPGLLAVLLAGGFCGMAAAQDKVFNWLPANSETVRLDPANFHTGRTYRPSSNGATNHVDIQSEKPVTIFMTPAEEWNAVLQNPTTLGQLEQYCVREHVILTTYVCEMPARPMTLVLRDERGNPDAAVFAGVGAVLDPEDKTQRTIGAGIAAVLTVHDSVKRKFVSPNDVHIQYYRWDCVENCIQPEFAWTQQVREKYQLSGFLKVYGGFAADHDGEPVSIRIKAPVPMLVAMLPSATANQLHARPELLEEALSKTACQQRGVQTMVFECKFDVGDGPQSLIVVPEDAGRVPHKKAEVEMSAARCVANCEMLQSKN